MTLSLGEDDKSMLARRFVPDEACESSACASALSTATPGVMGFSPRAGVRRCDAPDGRGDMGVEPSLGVSADGASAVHSSKVSPARGGVGGAVDDDCKRSLSRSDRWERARPSPRADVAEDSRSLRNVRCLLASWCLRDLATRSLWHAMHQIPWDVLAKTSSSMRLWQERHLKQSE